MIHRFRQNDKMRKIEKKNHGDATVLTGQSIHCNATQNKSFRPRIQPIIIVLYSHGEREEAVDIFTIESF